MPARKVGLPSDVPASLAHGLAAIRTTMGIPADFPAEVLAAGQQAARQPRLPELDRTDLELVTIDPPGSRDLDQALHIGRRPEGGYLVSYAIADVAAFVTAGDPVDSEAHRRGSTLYAPDHRTPLHPLALSEDAASLLPDQVRPALLWSIGLDAKGQTTDVSVVRARVRSREQLDYGQAQAEIDGGSPRESLALLKEVGLWREQRERDRGGVSLQIPEQEIQTTDHGWALTFRAPLPVEGWNAQVSLLTGMAAAHMMLYGQVGILRTMPPADPGSLRRLRQTAKALHIAWPAELDYPEFVRRLDPSRGDHAAMLNACTALFRGAGYQSFSGSVPEDPEHSAVASDYAHVTAPLRRLVDRYAGEVCVALCAGQPVPDWVLRALDALPEEMAATDRRAKKYERAIIDLVEVFLLSDRVGEIFTGTVVEADHDKRRGVVMIADPAVEARVDGDGLPLGQPVSVRLTKADFDALAVLFELA
jgi:exoribonuclease R